MRKSITDSIKTGDNNHLKEKLTEDPSLADSKTESGISLLQYAVYCRNTEAIDLIKRHKRLDLDIFEAASIGHNKTVEQLLAENPELLNSFSIDGFTLLGLASYFGHYQLVKFLLEKGSDPNTSSNNQFRVAPIHSACSISNYEIAELLLKYGAHANARQFQEYTPLHSAAHNDKIELARLLINHGADVNAKTYDGKTPLSIALENGFNDLAEIILYYGGLANKVENKQ